MPDSTSVSSLPTSADLDRAALADRLTRLAAAKTPKIAVIGDFCLDKYLFLSPELNEISVETGKTAFQIRARRGFAGAGGTVANNLRALGAATFCFGIVGEDGDGFELLKALRGIGADVSGMVASPEVLTSTYVKPTNPDGRGGWIESNRFDVRNPGPFPASAVDALKENFRKRVAEFDAVVVLEQFPPGSETTFSPDFRAFLADVARANPDVFFLCDSRFFAESYRETLVKCNANELLDVFATARGADRKRETTLSDDAESNVAALCEAGVWLAKRNGRPVLATRGALGSLLFDVAPSSQTAQTADSSPFSQTAEIAVFAVPPRPVEPPFDICGAGDATNAGFVFARSLGFSLVESAFLAGVVSSITIKQIGVTGTATVEQLVAALT
jgi:bifunctional ADP-heptose synthase (sugar kinase/adenylyltransferase)